jgi:predicted O-methyltransferase YrrM
MSGSAVAAAKRFLPKYLLALLSSPFLFTAGVFSRRHRYLIFRMAEHFGMKTPKISQPIPTIPLALVLDSKLDLTLLEPLGDPGNVTLLELMVVSSIAHRTIHPMVFEIGTFDGRTTLNIAANIAPDGKVYTLDLPESGLRKTKFQLEPGERSFVAKENSGAKFINTEFAAKITQLYGDSATFNFSSYLGRMGLVFVDGSHTYEYVRQDSETALRLTADGGIILWHDYHQDWPGVIAGLNELYQANLAFSTLRRIEGTTLVMLQRENTRR